MPLLSSPEPDTTGTIDGAAPRDDVLVAGAPDRAGPGLPPTGAEVDPAPNVLRYKRKPRSQVIDDGTPPPAQDAKVAEWRTYAVEHRGCDQATANGMTKAELIQVYASGPKASSVGAQSATEEQGGSEDGSSS